jgi:protein-S-isoprenylcysteine O-methyltransferase Ste14
MSWAKSLKATLWIVFMAVLLFVPAGTIDWRGGWIFMGEMVLGSLATILWLARHDPGLLAERMGGPIQKDQTFWDKVFMLTMVVVWYGWMVLMALDVKRWQFSHMPDWLTYCGAVLIPLGFLAVLRTFRENTFAAPVTKIQSDRGQKVIDTGPYAIVRHPMYAGALFYMLGTPLVLGSWIGLGVLPLIVGLLMARIPIEEATLRQGLAGYDAYAERVRYRLIPGIW